MKKAESKVSKLATKAKWVLYSSVALNTMLLIAGGGIDPKKPWYVGE